MAANTYRVSMLPGLSQTVASDGPMSLGRAIDEAGFNREGFVVSVNGLPTDNFAQVLTPGADVYLTRASKGA